MEGEEDMIHLNGGLDFDDEKDDCDQEKKEFEAWVRFFSSSNIMLTLMSSHHSSRQPAPRPSGISHQTL
jgi:hypothetical protein